MVTAISSTSATTSTTALDQAGATSASLKSSIAKLESQITSKEEELASAETDDQKSEINDELTDLRASLAKLEAQQAQMEAAENAAKTTAKTPTAEQAKPALLSGESDKIGSTNYDEETPFGDRYAYV